MNPLPFSKTALVLIPRLIPLHDRERMLSKFEAHARASHASQIGANHVLEVIVLSRYYATYGDGLQGGPGSGPTDPPRDHEAERAWVRSAPFPPLQSPQGPAR
jgi:hypothetical protein